MQQGPWYPNGPVGYECDKCGLEVDAPLPDNWLLEPYRNKTTGKLVDTHYCPKCQ